MNKFQKIKSLYNSIYPFLVFVFFMLYLVVSPINRIIPFSPNRLLVALFFVLVCLRAIFNLIKKPTFYIFVAFLLFVLIYTSFKSGSSRFFENLEDYIYFVMTLICFVSLADIDLVKQLKILFLKFKLICLICALVTILLFGLSLFFESSYEDGGSFRGFTVVSHSVATVSIFAMVLMIASHIILPIWYLPFVFFIYLSQARTFLLLMIPIILFYCLILFKKKRYSFLLFFGLIAVFAGIIPFTPVWDKMLNLSHGTWFRHHPIDAISSTRSLMWTDCLRAFIESSPIMKVFGGGFSYVKDIISADLTGRVWAHNDFVELLVATGIIGFVGFYIIFTFGLSKQPNSSKIAIISLYIISAAFNGFILYFPLSLSVIALSAMYSEDIKPCIIAEEGMQNV